MSALRVKSGTRLIRDRIFKCRAFRVVFLKPFCGSIRGGEHLDVLGVGNLLAGVDVNKDGQTRLLSQQVLRVD
jgi:hypothetical protein